MRKVIGLLGFAGSGKGTVADILVDQYGYTKISIADSVKDVASVLFGWPRDLLEGDTKESREFRETKDLFWTRKLGYDFTPRMALQKIGTEAGREVFHPDLWIFTLEKKLEYSNRIVIADTRFPNEIQFLKNKGAQIVTVTRGNYPEWYAWAVKQNRRELCYDHMQQYYPDVHISEWARLGTKEDYIIPNEGDLKDLEREVKLFLQWKPKRDIMILSENKENIYNETI